MAVSLATWYNRLTSIFTCQSKRALFHAHTHEHNLDSAVTRHEPHSMRLP